MSFQQLEYFSNNKPHFSSAYDITSKQVLVPKRGKKKYQRFLYPVNHLNQRKSPSALLVSKEIETDFNRSSFFQKSRKVPEVTHLSISCGWGVVCRVSSLSSWRKCVLGVNEVAGGFLGVCGGRDEGSSFFCFW